MDFQDIRTLPPGGLIETNICIVGAGPIGLTLAAELAGSRRKVLVVESGGRVPDAWADALNEIESVGAPRVLDQTLVRNRGLGGTSRTWSGRLAAFEEFDFAQRPWIPGSGWPISRAVVEPYLERTLNHAGGVVADNVDPAFLDVILKQDRRLFDADRLTDYLWSYSQDAARRRDFMRFGPRAAKIEADGVEGLLSATVTQIETDPEGRSVTGIEIMGPDGAVRRIRTTITVLCAGGIENARIMLASRRTLDRGIGNAHDQVGRYLMDHPRGPVGAFRPADRLKVQMAFGSFRPSINGKPVVLTRGVALSPEVQKAEQLVAAAAWINGRVSDDDPLVALLRLARLRGSPAQPLKEIAREFGLLAWGAERLIRKRSPVRKFDWLHLECIVEQPPYADSRIVLSEKVDAYGVPLSRIDWKVGQIESRSVRALARLFCSEAARVGLPAPDLEDWVLDDSAPIPLPDVAHPMGTTRMSDHPTVGVVDRDCRVHGMSNLFVAGTSIFTTSGHANPTQTALALAIRLADHLKTEGAKIQPPPALAAPAPQRRVSLARPDSKDGKPVILVTGGSGKIGSAVVKALIERGYGVRALTSRLRPPSRDPQLQWVTHDLRQADLDFSADVEGCAGVLHLGAELKHEEDMVRVNVEATRALAEAAEAAGVRFMAYASSVSVYGSQHREIVDETAETLTADRDVVSEYWGDSALRTYGRTKLGGELAIKQVARNVEYVIFRPTVVVDLKDVREVLNWGTVRRALLAHRNAHHVFVGDVAAAFVWALERSLARPTAQAGVDIFNLGDDTVSDPTVKGFFAEAIKTAPDVIKTVQPLPRAVDWGKDIVRYRSGLRPRRPLGMMRFPARRLSEAGFRPPIGMTRIRAEAIAALKEAKVTGTDTESRDR